ncbi:MAG: DUF167 domain-containing protein [Polyangiales bacterium]
MTDELRLTETANGVVFDVRAVPRASRDAIAGVMDGAIKLAITAPPVDGEANAAIVAFFAKALRVPKSDVRLVRGERSKQKSVEVRGRSAADVRGLLSSGKRGG